MNRSRDSYCMTVRILFLSEQTSLVLDLIRHVLVNLRPENWQQIVDELLEILGASDSLLQEESP